MPWVDVTCAPNQNTGNDPGRFVLCAQITAKKNVRALGRCGRALEQVWQKGESGFDFQPGQSQVGLGAEAATSLGIIALESAVGRVHLGPIGEAFLKLPTT